MNKGYAFGFLLVLLVVILGFYVAYTGFMSTRQTLRSQPTSPATEAARATPRPTRPAPTVTTTVTLTTTVPTGIAGITATLTAVVLGGTAQPVTGTEPAATMPPTAPAEPTAEVGLPTEPQPSALPPTPIPISQYEFRLGGPAGPDPNYPNCCYIYGTVRDAAGQGLEGVRVQMTSLWSTEPITAVSKGGVDLGRYDIPLGRDVITWNIVVVDANGNQISPPVPVPFDPNKANAFRIDWQRTH